MTQPEQRSTRALMALCAAGLATFLAFITAAAARYPGGTWFQYRTRGYSFWDNFLCDLFHSRALNGQDNSASARLATVATLAMLCALAAFFALIGRLDPRAPRASRVARSAGALACVLGVALPLTPSDHYRTGHLVAVVAACIPAIIATAASLWICFRAKVSLAISALAAATLLFSVIDAVLYVIAFAVTAQLDRLYRLLPVFQRLATISLLAWVLAVLVAHAGRARTHSAAPL